MKTPPYHITSFYQNFRLYYQSMALGLLQQKVPSKIITIINTFVIVVVVVVHPG